MLVLIELLVDTVIVTQLAHQCYYPGCRSVLVMDGNMKNRRDVCYAKDAGFIQFDGLSGLIKTGCSATPAYKSRYCSNHANHSCTLSKPEDLDDEIRLQMGSSVGACKITSSELIAEMILAKKTTRKQCYYQVELLCTNLPNSVLICV